LVTTYLTIWCHYPEQNMNLHCHISWISLCNGLLFLLYKFLVC
jgi:hypothetical protein